MTVSQVDCSCSFNLDECLKKLGLNEYGRVQCVVDETFIRGVEPYVPLDTGLLKSSVLLHTVVGSGEIVWNAENKARRLYYGEMDWNWSNGGVQQGGFRGPYWANRYIQNGGQEEVENAARKEAGK